MATARHNTEAITDWQSFHEACQEVFGFPYAYGRNRNAWIDRLSYLDAGDGLSRFQLARGEMLHVGMPVGESFNARLPEIFDALCRM